MPHPITMEIYGTTYPAKYEICSHCRGTGTGYLGNRGFVLTQEDFDQDPDLKADIMEGVYDQSCEHCGGTGKVKVPATAVSWATPAKHARGNIFDADNGLGIMGPYGPAYLR